MRKIKVLFALIAILSFLSWTFDSKFKRIIIEEYPGATIFPEKCSKQDINCDLYDHRYLKITLFDYRGKMHLQCYSQDSVLREEGDYVNSLALLKKYSSFYVSGTSKIIISVIEYYQPLRNGSWIFYDSTGRKTDSAFYMTGIKQ